MTFTRPSRHEWLVCLLLTALLLLTWFASHAALKGPFLFDDFPNFENLREISGCLNGDRVSGYLASFLGTPGRPLAALSFLIDDYAWPSTPYSWKRHNLLLHLLCGILVFGLTRTLARTRHTQATANWVALGTAAAWLLHPMQLSTSMLTVQRMTQLMTLASLSTCWWVAHRLAKRPLDWTETLKLLAFGAVMTTIAFLCKENGALLPLYIAITSAWMLRDRHHMTVRPGQTYFAALLLPVVGIVVALAYNALVHETNGIRTFNPWERLLTESRVVWDYLRQILLPRMDGSGVFHDDIVISRSLLSPPVTLLTTAATACLCVLAFIKRKTWPLLAFAVAWFFGGHLMESTTWPLELYFEHRNYLPMIGVLAAIGMYLPSIASVKIKHASILAILTWLAMCAGMTFSSASVWGSSQLQAAIWAKEHPNSMRATELQAKYLVDHHALLAAREFITARIQNDRKFNPLAIHVLLVNCHSGRLTPQDMDWAIALLKDSDFNRSTLNSLSILRTSMQENVCQTPALQRKWIELAESLLSNRAYASNDVQAFLYVELLQEGMHRRDYDFVIRNLGAAYAANPDPVLAATMAYLLTDGGYKEEAKKWRLRAERMPAPWPIPWWNWWKRITHHQVEQCAAP